jgi:hypothetical protein
MANPTFTGNPWPSNTCLNEIARGSGAGGGGGGGGAVTIAAGADATEGNTTDAVVAAGAAGTVSAKLRRLTTDIDAIKTSVAAATPAGTALIGKIGIDQTTAGSTNGVQRKQYTGTPSNFSVATADGTVFTLAAGEVGFIQNLDSADALAVKYGATASTSSFNFILPSGGAQDDGRGGSAVIDDWIGVVSVATMSGVGRYIAWKGAP